VVNNRAEIAHRYDLSRARVTQIMNLLKLPDAIKKQILELPEPERHKFCERKLRKFIKAYQSKGNPGPKKSDKTSAP
jgi:hypothetical protein